MSVEFWAFKLHASLAWRTEKLRLVTHILLTFSDNC